MCLAICAAIAIPAPNRHAVHPLAAAERLATRHTKLENTVRYLGIDVDDARRWLSKPRPTRRARPASTSLEGGRFEGAKPVGLPVEPPTKFKLVINVTTAKSLGVTIPQSLLLRADEVIQSLVPALPAKRTGTFRHAGTRATTVTNRRCGDRSSPNSEKHCKRRSWRIYAQIDRLIRCWIKKGGYRLV